jgi:predicted DNA-binding protein
MVEQKAVSTRIASETDERLQTVVDARGTTKAEYIREAVKDALSSDHDDLSEEDKTRAELSELKREIEGTEQEESSSGLPDPLGIFG